MTSSYFGTGIDELDAFSPDCSCYAVREDEKIILFIFQFLSTSQSNRYFLRNNDGN